MAKTIKITIDELKAIQDFKLKYDQISLGIGRNVLQMKLVTTEQDNLTKQYDELVKQEQGLHDEIIKKYGTGNLNFQTGEYTPLTPPEESKVEAKLEDAEIATENPSEK